MGSENVPETTEVVKDGSGNLNETQNEQTVAQTVEQAVEQTVQKPAWMSQLPDDLKSNENLAKYKTMGEAIKSLMEKNSQMENSQKETVEPEKVEYTDFENKINAEDDPFGDLQSGYTELFKSKNIKQSDAEELIKSMNEINMKAKGIMLEKGKSLAEEVAKQNWGKEYQKNRTLMAKGYQALDPEGKLQESLDKSGASLMPPVWDLLVKVGSLVSEDKGTMASSNSGRPSNGIPVDYSKPSP